MRAAGRGPVTEDESRIARWVEEVLRGSPQAISRLISLVENRPEEAVPLLRALHPHTGRGYVVGVTGPPGTGKSTLLDALIRDVRRQGKRVGVVAVDPTSPFSGGAILGDRIRMQDHSTDPGVFLRSMATRGHMGGLAPAAAGAVQVLDASGCDLIFVETVGTGQAEVDVVGAADTVIVVTVPSLGDSIQTLKAGVMEIGDIFVVNKADRGNADRTAQDIRAMLALAGARDGWDPPVLLAVATAGIGVREILKATEDHQAYQRSRGILAARRQLRRQREILRIMEDRLRSFVLHSVGPDRLDDLAARVASGEMDPYTAASLLLEDLGLG